MTTASMVHQIALQIGVGLTYLAATYLALSSVVAWKQRSPLSSFLLMAAAFWLLVLCSLAVHK